VLAHDLVPLVLVAGTMDARAAGLIAILVLCSFAVAQSKCVACKVSRCDHVEVTRFPYPYQHPTDASTTDALVIIQNSLHMRALKSALRCRHPGRLNHPQGHLTGAPNTHPRVSSTSLLQDCGGNNVCLSTCQRECPAEPPTVNIESCKRYGEQAGKDSAAAACSLTLVSTMLWCAVGYLAVTSTQLLVLVAAPASVPCYQQPAVQEAFPSFSPGQFQVNPVTLGNLSVQ